MQKPGDELHDYRKKKDLSQEELGKLLEASQPQVSRIEGGKCPTLAQALTIERVAGIAVERWPWSGAVLTVIRRRMRRAS